jgi:P4 family phage/plasmid primase-like protien
MPQCDSSVNGKIDVDALKLSAPGILSCIENAQKVSHDEWASPCPKCGGSDRFRVWPGTGKFWCRQCEWKGDAIDFLAWKHNTDLKGVAELFGPDAGEPGSEPVGKEKPPAEDKAPDAGGDMIELWTKIIKEWTNPTPVEKYLTGQRKISPEVVQAARDNNNISFNRYGGKEVLAIAYRSVHNPAEVPAIQFISTTGAPLLPTDPNSKKIFAKGSKPKSDCFFSAGQKLESATTIVLVEAPINALTAAMFCPDACCLALGGAGFTGKVKALREYARPEAKVICVFDNDDAGNKAILAVSKGLTGMDIRTIIWGGEYPEGYDINDLLKMVGGAAVQEKMQNDEIVRPKDAEPAKEEKKKRESNPEQNVAAFVLANTKLKNRYAFDGEAEKWRAYIDGTWKIPHPQAFKDEVYRLMQEDNKLFPQGFTSSYLGGVAELLKCELRFVAAQDNGSRIPFKNGILDVVTKKFSPNNPENKITWQIPCDYSPRATCEPIQKWLLETVGGDQALFYLLRCFWAAALYGLSRAHRFLELSGAAGSGKSTYLNLAEQIVGPQNSHTTELKHLENGRFETAAILGKRLVVITDAGKYGGDIAILKALTGGDPIRREEKYRQCCAAFHPEAIVMIATNEPIQSTEYTNGLKRRRVTVFLNKAVPLEKQRDLMTEFRPHLSGLVNWLLELTEAEVFRCLKSTGGASQRQGEKKCLVETNPIAAWADRELCLLPSAKSYIGVARKVKNSVDVIAYENSDIWLYANYAQYCDVTGQRVISMKRFVGLLEDLLLNQLHLPHVGRGRDRDGSHFDGIAIKTPSTELLPSPVGFCFDMAEGEL